MAEENPWGPAAWMAISEAADMKLLRSRNLHPGIPRRYLQLALAMGIIERVWRGVYAGKNLPKELRTPFAIAIELLPTTGYVCLNTAAWVHGFIDSEPKLCICISHKATEVEMPQPVDWFRTSGGRLLRGVKVLTWRGLTFPVTTEARTISDAFRFEDRLREGSGHLWLRRYLLRPDADRIALMKVARLCRVEGRMKREISAIDDEKARIAARRGGRL